VEIHRDRVARRIELRIVGMGVSSAIAASKSLGGSQAPERRLVSTFACSSAAGQMQPNGWKSPANESAPVEARDARRG